MASPLRRVRCLVVSCVVLALFVLLQLTFAAYVMQLRHRTSAEEDTQHLEAERPLVAQAAAVSERQAPEGEASFDQTGPGANDADELIAQKEHELAVVKLRLAALAEAEAASSHASPRAETQRLASLHVVDDAARSSAPGAKRGTETHGRGASGRDQPPSQERRSASSLLSPLPPSSTTAGNGLDSGAASSTSGGAEAALARTARRKPPRMLRRNMTSALDALLMQELRWDFGRSEVDEAALELHRCLGKGSYGMVLEGSVLAGAGGLPGSRHHRRAQKVVVKLPTIRHWGYRFYRTELEALLAVRDASGASARDEATGVGGAERARSATAARRNVVRLLGNTSVALDMLLTRDSQDERWGCINRTDLLIAASHGARYLPAMLLEPLSNTSLFRWLAAVAAPTKEGVSLSLQRRFFKMQYAKAVASSAEMGRAFQSAYDVLIGFARGVALLHSLHMVHRDLTEPGKNVLLRLDEHGLTATLIDLSQAQRCPAGRGAAARSVDMYAFGHVLYFACYGRVVHGLPWTKFSCNGSPRALADLLPIHAEAHPNGRVSAAGHVNRCSPRAQAPLHELMEYCWEPALLVARANSADAGVAARSARSNHTWDHVLQRLATLRETGVPLLIKPS